MTAVGMVAGVVAGVMAVTPEATVAMVACTTWYSCKRNTGFVHSLVGRSTHRPAAVIGSKLHRYRRAIRAVMAVVEQVAGPHWSKSHTPHESTQQPNNRTSWRRRNHLHPPYMLCSI